MLALLTVLPFHYSNNHAYERKELGNYQDEKITSLCHYGGFRLSFL